MADKSPRQRLTQKAGKSLKEKRSDKRAKSEAKRDGKGNTPFLPSKG